MNEDAFLLLKLLNEAHEMYRATLGLNPCRRCDGKTCDRCAHREATLIQIAGAPREKIKSRVGDLKLVTLRSSPFSPSKSKKRKQGKRRKKNFVCLRRKNFLLS
jgi:hypothetical protein